MTVRVVKYVCTMSPDTKMDCQERSIECAGKADLHVCFDEGKGVFVCRECFDKCVNEGSWKTDRAGVLLAS